MVPYMISTVSFGESNEGRPPTGGSRRVTKIFLISCIFEKSAQNRILAPPGGLWPIPTEIPGSAPGKYSPV